MKEWQTFYRQSSEFPKAEQAQSPAKDVLLALSKFDSDLAEIKAAAARPSARFPVRYEDGGIALLPHVQHLRSVARLLALRASAKLADGDADGAFEDISLGLRVINTIEDEPLLISQLVRIAALKLLLQPIWEGLAEHRWKEEHLRRLQLQLGKTDMLAAAQLAIRGERSIFFTQFVEKEIIARGAYRQVGNVLQLMGTDEDFPSLQLWRLAIMPRGWFYQDMVFGCTFFQQSIESASPVDRRVDKQKLTQAQNDLIANHKKPMRMLSSLLLSAVSGFVANCSAMQSDLDEAVIACALERYRLAHGQFPDRLDALPPQFIENLPHDIINGQPLKYRRTDDGQFVLYSVGWDEKDDDGTTSKTAPIEEGDWVWRYPPK